MNTQNKSWHVLLLLMSLAVLALSALAWYAEPLGERAEETPEGEDAVQGVVVWEPAADTVKSCWWEDGQPECVTVGVRLVVVPEVAR